MPDRILQEIALIEIKKMLGESQAISKIDHPYLKGKIREIGFGKLLSKFIPEPFKIGSGKIHDCHGKPSPEVDLIIYNPSLLPPLTFNEELGIYPLESTFYSIEIKSAITTTRQSIIDSLNNCRKIRGLTFLNNYGGHPIITYPACIYFSYGCNSELDVFDIIKENDENYNEYPLLSAICIANKGYWFFSHWKNQREWIKIHSTIDNYEILGILGGIVNTLIGPNRSLYGYYLLNPLNETKHDILYQE